MAESAESKSPRIKHRTSHAKPGAEDKLNNYFEGGIPKDYKFVDLIGFLRKALDKSPLSEEESQTLIIQLEGMFHFQEDKSLELLKECEQAKSQSEILEIERSKMQSSIQEQEDNLKRQLVSLEEEKLRAESKFKERENQLKSQLQELENKNLKMKDDMKDLECEGLREHCESLKKCVNIFDKTIDRVPEPEKESLSLLVKKEINKINVPGISTNNTATDTAETPNPDNTTQ